MMPKYSFMHVPLLDLERAVPAAARRDPRGDHARVDSQRFIMGPEIAALESELARMLGVAHAVAVSSGTDALLLALMALGVTAGDEVVTSAYSFFATAGAIARLGARPVFVDIDPETFNVDPACVEAAITPRTSAILPVHLFGQSADLDPIMAVAAKRAGVAGGRRRRAGDWRDLQVDAPSAASATFGCFSFFPSKNLGRVRRCGPSHDQRCRRSRPARAVCGRTARSRSTTITSSAAIFGWTRCRPRSCA